MSARAFFYLGICWTLTILKSKESFLSFCKYLIIIGSQALYSHTWPMISNELVKALSFSTTNSLEMLRPMTNSLYLASLCEALKLNQNAYLVTSPSRLKRMRLTLLPYELETPSTCRIHCDPSSYIGGFYKVDSSSRIVNLAMKSTKT